MDTDIILVIILLGASGFFSGAETSLTTLGKAKLKKKLEEGERTALILDSLLQTPGKLLATILVGNNLVNIAFTVVSTQLLSRMLASSGWSEGVMAVVITLILSFFVLIFGEIVPKMLALSKTTRFAYLVARPLFFIKRLLGPVVWVINGLARLLVRVFGIKALERGQFVSEEELKTMIEIGREEGILAEDERQMLAGIFDLGDTVVREIMTPRVDVVSVNVKTPLAEILKLVTEKGHSRLPVYEEKRENIIGILYAKDLLKFALQQETNIRGILRPVQFVPETKKIDTLLKKMRTKRSHLAVVIDEHGGVSGLITIEDILEEIVGEINDEYDQREAPTLIPVNDNVFLIDAGVNVHDLNERLNLRVPEGEDYDTIGGFVSHELGEIPQIGEKVCVENLTLEVTQAKKQRLLQLKLTIQEVATENHRSQATNERE